MLGLSGGDAAAAASASAMDTGDGVGEWRAGEEAIVCVNYVRAKVYGIYSEVHIL